MTEQWPNTFAIALSPSLTELLRSHGVLPKPDALALAASAEQLKAPLPEQPRVVVVNAGEAIYTGQGDRRQPISLIIPESDELQLVPENDLIVVLKRYNNISQSEVTEGIALDLLLRRRAAQRRVCGHIGRGLIGAGLVAIGTGSPTMNNTLGGIGGGLFAAGTGLIAFTHSRDKPKVPNAADLPAPVVFDE